MAELSPRSNGAPDPFDGRHGNELLDHAAYGLVGFFLHSATDEQLVRAVEVWTQSTAPHRLIAIEMVELEQATRVVRARREGAQHG